MKREGGLALRSGADYSMLKYNGASSWFSQAGASREYRLYLDATCLTTHPGHINREQ